MQGLQGVGVQVGVRRRTLTCPFVVAQVVQVVMGMTGEHLGLFRREVSMRVVWVHVSVWGFIFGFCV